MLGGVKIGTKGVGQNKQIIPHAERICTGKAARDLTPNCLSVLLVVARDHADGHANFFQPRHQIFDQDLGITHTVIEVTALGVPRPVIQRIVTE